MAEAVYVSQHPDAEASGLQSGRESKASGWAWFQLIREVWAFFMPEIERKV